MISKKLLCVLYGIVVIDCCCCCCICCCCCCCSCCCCCCCIVVAVVVLVDMLLFFLLLLLLLLLLQFSYYYGTWRQLQWLKIGVAAVRPRHVDAAKDADRVVAVHLERRLRSRFRELYRFPRNGVARPQRGGQLLVHAQGNLNHVLSGENIQGKSRS